MKNVIKLLTLGMGFVLVLNAQAAPVGTAAGTDITNSASLGFKVDGVSQAAIPSNTTTFKVDRKVNFTVSEVGSSATDVVPSQNCASPAGCAVLTFSVDNQGNYPADFSLAAVNDTGDDFNPTTNLRFVEDGTTAGYQAAEDTATYIDELPSGDSVTVYIVSDIPASTINLGSCTAVCNTDTAKVHLQATAAAGGTASSLGADLVATGLTTADTAGTVDVIFADGIGSASGDVARDGKHSDDDDFDVVTASLTVTKSTYVIWDPINCTGTAAGLTPSVANTKDASCGANEPKRIPGAVIHYQIAVANTGVSAADELNLTDTISADQTYLAGSIFVDGNAEDDNSTGVDDTPINGGNPTAGNISGAVVTGSIFTLGGGATKNVHFNVTIN